MGIFRCRQYFQAGPYRWSEDFFRTGESAESALEALERVARYRSALLSPAEVLAHLVVTDLAVPGASLVRAVQGQMRLGEPRVVWEAALVRLQGRQDTKDGPALVHRTYFVRGGDRSALTEKNLGRYFDAVVKEGFSLGVYDRNVQKVAVLEVWPDIEEGYMDLVLNQQAPLPLEDPVAGGPTRVKISGVKWASPVPRPNPLREVRLLVDSSEWLALLAGDIPDSASYQGGGELTLRRPVFVPVSGWNLRGYSYKKTGRGRGPDQRFAGSGTPLISGGSGGGFGRFLRQIAGVPQAAPLALIPVVPTKPPAITIRTLKELAVDIGFNYDKAPISIGRVLNFQSCWLVELSGTQFGTGHATGFEEDIRAGLNYPNYFNNALLDAVQKTVPPGSMLILAGHSLGGMVAQNGIPHLKKLGYQPAYVITLGSPVTRVDDDTLTYRRFMAARDIVPRLSPMGAALWALGSPEQIHVETGGSPLPGAQHSSYAVSVAFDGYDALGNFIGTGQGISLLVDEERYFDVPRPQDLGLRPEHRFRKLSVSR